MKFFQEHIESKTGYRIFIRSWVPEIKPKINILIVHGLGEHSGRYKNFAKNFENKKVGIYSFDLIGHGKSSGLKGHIGNFEEFIDATEDALIYVRKQNLDIPIVLFGHSLGGLISLFFLIERESREIHSSIISSPWIKTVVRIPPLLIIFQKLLKNIIPMMRLNNRLETAHLSKDERVVNEYENDKLVHNKISLNLFSEITNAINLVLEKSDRIKIKTLLYHGNEDKIISAEGTKHVSEKINKSNFHLFNNVYHEPHNDLEKNEVYNKIFEFIQIK